MNQLPAVSVIMPAFNASKTIETSIASVQEQSLQNWELIIVDDGSTDNTASVAVSAAKKDPRICVVQRRNCGPSVARNAGVSEARSQVLAFIDADDFWAPDRLTGMLIKFRDEPSTGVVFSRTRFVDAVTLKAGTLTPHHKQLTAADIMSENALCSTSNITCLKKVFQETGGFTPGLDYAEDQDWLLRVALADKWQIRGVDAEWFFYRSAEQSQSANLEAMRTGWHRMVEAACGRHGHTARQAARKALRMGEPSEALRYLWLGLRRDPALIIRQPKRTILTLVGTILSYIPSSTLKEIVAR